VIAQVCTHATDRTADASPYCWIISLTKASKNSAAWQNYFYGTTMAARNVEFRRSFAKPSNFLSAIYSRPPDWNK